MHVFCIHHSPPTMKNTLFFLALAVIIFSLCFHLDWSAIKTLTYPLLSFSPLSLSLPPPHYDRCLDFSGISM